MVGIGCEDWILRLRIARVSGKARWFEVRGFVVWASVHGALVFGRQGQSCSRGMEQAALH